MKAQGCAIIIITHKLDEVMEISDRVTILRKGKSVETVQTAESSEKSSPSLWWASRLTFPSSAPSLRM